MYEYRTASFLLTAKKHGEPLKEVDLWLNQQISDGWDFVQMTHSITAVAMSVVVVLRKVKPA